MRPVGCDHRGGMLRDGAEAMAATMERAATVAQRAWSGIAGIDRSASISGLRHWEGPKRGGGAAGARPGGGGGSVTQAWFRPRVTPSEATLTRNMRRTEVKSSPSYGSARKGACQR